MLIKGKLSTIIKVLIVLILMVVIQAFIVSFPQLELTFPWERLYA